MWILGIFEAALGGSAIAGGLPLWLVAPGDLGSAGQVATVIGIPVLALGIWTTVRNKTHVTTERGDEITRIAPSRSERGLGMTASGVAWSF